MKIQKINFFDYRAFYNGIDNQYLIDTGGKNLLIYGENGSGKTSLFKGLNDFIQGNDFVSHNQTPRLDEGFIEVELSDGTIEKLAGSGAKPTNPEILNAAKLNSFLSYKELLKTYLFENDDKEVNLFSLLINGVLKDHTLSTLGHLQSAWKELSSRTFAEAKYILERGNKKGELTPEELNEQIEILNDEYKKQFEKFQDELSVLIKEINSELSNFLHYFDNNIEALLVLEPIKHNEFEKAKIGLEVNYYKKGISNHHDFLNEARLSSLALSIFMASIKSNPTQNNLRVFLLDDIFIGLDMNNRLPLLEILKKEFTAWQIFLTTYDRHWFEIAKHYLKTNWTAIEMFAGRIDGQNFEHPILISNSDDYFIKSKKYFETKDYPACLNYLRKEFERLIKERLPEENIRYFEGKPHGLLFLWEICLERYANLGIPINPTIKDDFNTTRLTLLNPQSHDSLNFPIYEYEIRKAFELIDKLKQCPIITNIVLLSKGTSINFQHPTQDYHFIFKLVSDWRLDIHNNTKSNVFPKCKVISWSFEGNEYWDFKSTKILSADNIEKALNREDRLDKILSNLEKLPLANISNKLILESSRAEDTWSLKELIDKIDDTDPNNSIQRIIFWTKIKNIFNAI